MPTFNSLRTTARALLQSQGLQSQGLQSQRRLLGSVNNPFNNGTASQLDTEHSANGTASQLDTEHSANGTVSQLDTEHSANGTASQLRDTKHSANGTASRGIPAISQEDLRKLIRDQTRTEVSRLIEKANAEAKAKAEAQAKADAQARSATLVLAAISTAAAVAVVLPEAERQKIVDKLVDKLKELFPKPINSQENSDETLLSLLSLTEEQAAQLSKDKNTSAFLSLTKKQLVEIVLSNPELLANFDPDNQKGGNPKEGLPAADVSASTATKAADQGLRGFLGGRFGR